MFLRPAAAVVLTLAALAAGCGGDDSGSAEADWAQSVCEPFTAWQSEMRGVAEELRDPADPLGTLRSAGERASDATENLLGELEGAGEPPGGGEATGVLEGLLTSLRTAQQALAAQLGQLDSIGPAEAASAIGLVAGQFSAAVAQVEAAFQSLRTADEGLEEGFAEAEACQELEG